MVTTYELVKRGCGEAGQTNIEKNSRGAGFFVGVQR